MEHRKNDSASEVHFHTDRFWLDSSGWFYSLRGNQIKGPFASRDEAVADFKKLMPKQTAEPVVCMAIGRRALLFHGDLHALDQDSLLVRCHELISYNCVELSCMVYITSTLAGEMVEFEIKCHIDKISEEGVKLSVQKSDPENSKKQQLLIEHMTHLI